MKKSGYKHTPLGWIPEDWEVKKIKDIAKISSGTTPLRSVAEYHTNGTIYWVKTTDLNNSVVLDTEEKVTELALKETSLRVYPKGTVLVAMYGGFNQIGRTGLLGIDATINQALSAITVNSEKTDVKFLLDWLNANVGLWKSFAGSSRKDPNITSNDVGDFPIVDITLPEQRRIAAILSIWDAAISKEKQFIEALQIRHRGLMQQLLSGRKRLKGFKGKWKDVSYGSLLKEVKRPVLWNDNERYQLVSVRRRSGGIFSREALFGHQIKVKDLRTVNTGDFLFSKMQIVHGASALVTEKFAGNKISGSYIAVVSKDPKKLNIQFLNWYSQLPYFYHQTYISSFGVHIEKMTFDFEAFLTLNMALPSLEEQTAISTILSTSEKEIKTHDRRLAYLQQQKKGLMQILLTGKVRVKT
ncbi:type I restriction enzyme, S subunit [Chitinophaga sp. YR627]|uniref:restriction endonuclease subunit S n=1 Tax=Chitinophaga sp. YR627 TaxID=1881041 RepID=UPI0008EB4A69|nr:restriction endonuclease subunit S [Chitinophaga sp. YR627]SFN34390.1 type I restriction enzyme, S subunit [Chitinophaga sp. YR627]